MYLACGEFEIKCSVAHWWHWKAPCSPMLRNSPAFRYGWAW